MDVVVRIRWTRLSPAASLKVDTDRIRMQCSAGKPWSPAFIWIPLESHHRTKHHRTPSTTPGGKGAPSRTTDPATLETLPGSEPRTMIPSRSGSSFRCTKQPVRSTEAPTCTALSGPCRTSRCPVGCEVGPPRTGPVQAHPTDVRWSLDLGSVEAGSP